MLAPVRQDNIDTLSFRSISFQVSLGKMAQTNINRKGLVNKMSFQNVSLRPLTPTEWTLCKVSSGLLLIVGSVTIITLAILGLPRFERRDICLTEACVRAAGRILTGMDESVNPCEDFYTFACGKWIRNNPVPETQGSWNQFNVLHEQLTWTLREILERKRGNSSETELRPVAIARDMYQTCIDQEQEDSLEELRHLVKEYVGDLEVDFNNIGQVSGKLCGIKTDLWESGFLLDAYVYLGLDNPDEHTLFLGPPQLWLPQPFFLENSTKHIDAYAGLISKIWPLVFPAESGSVASLEIIHFTRVLAENILRQEERRNKTKVYRPMTVGELMEVTKNAPMLNWEAFMDEIFATVPAVKQKIKSWKDLKITVGDLNYFENLGPIIAAAGPEIIRKYMTWGIIHEYGAEASPAARKIFFEYAQETKGTKHPNPRWKHCTQWISSKLGKAISYHYALENFNRQSKAQVEEIFNDIGIAFEEILKELDWIEDDTRKVAEAKFRQMRAYIAYPDYLEENTSVILDYYKDLKEANRSSHLRNDVETSKFVMEKNFADIILSRDYYIWREHAAIVNAFYYPTFNAVYLPAGILQVPLFGYPIQALNYGGVGTVIGHEITHGFDDEGRQKDGDGKLVNWWDNTTLYRFLTRAHCFINQYNGLFLPEVNTTVNGINTQGENIADNGAIYQAFRGYMKYKERHGGEEQWLPGLNYSPDQLFFIGYGQKWCETITEETLYNRVKTGAHSPSKFRANAVLHNFEEFSTIWGCPAPKQKCRIW